MDQFAYTHLLPLIDMSSAASSVEQIVRPTSFCSDSIDGANSNISSSYNIISIIDEHVRLRLQRDFKFTSVYNKVVNVNSKKIWR